MFAWLQRLFGRNQPPASVPTIARTQVYTTSQPAAADVFSVTEIQNYTPEMMVLTPELSQPEIDLLSENVIAHAMTRLDDLPSFPSMAAEVFGIIEHPDFEMSQLIKAISRDTSISASVLRASNSAAFGTTKAVETVRDAVVRLGAKETAKAVSAAATRALFDLEARVEQELFVEHWKGLWKSALTCAYGGAWIAMNYRKGDFDRVFLGGMLSNIGKTSALRSLSSMAMSQKVSHTLSAPVVTMVLAHVNERLTREVVAKWNLPETIANILLNEDLTDANTGVVRLVNSMDAIRATPWHGARAITVFERSVAALKLSDAQLRALNTQMSEIEQSAASTAGV